MDSSEKRWAENTGPEFQPPEEADGQPWNDLPDAPQDSAPPPPEEPDPAPAPVKAPRTVPLLAYLTALLAAGFLLMTAVCVLQFRDSQRELDEVRGALENVQAMDALREENAQLQETIDGLTAAAEETEQEMWELQGSLHDAKYEAYRFNMERDLFCYLWFIQNFMEDGNYAMAANALVYGGDACYWLDLYGLSQWNPQVQEQYGEYRQRLIELGWLGESDFFDVYADGSVSRLYIMNNETGREMTLRLKLWLALKLYYIDDDAMAAATYLMDWSNARQELIEQERGSFAIDQYELLLERLMDDGFLFETESGGLDFGPRFYEDGITNDAYDDGPTAD